MTLAIGFHNIPEGLALSMVMVQQGSSLRAAALWTVLSSLPQPLIAVPAFVFVDTFQKLLPLGKALFSMREARQKTRGGKVFR